MTNKTPPASGVLFCINGNIIDARMQIDIHLFLCILKRYKKKR